MKEELVFWIVGTKTHLFAFALRQAGIPQRLIWSSNARTGRHQRTLFSSEDEGQVKTTLRDFKKKTNQNPTKCRS